MKAIKTLTPSKKSPHSKPVKPKKDLSVDTGLNAGDRLPRFSALNESGDQFSHQDLKGKKVVIYFYPKDMTSGCTQESCDFRDAFNQFKKKGYQIFGVSKDSVASHKKFKAKYDLHFELLSDPEATMCEAFGVWKEKSMYGRKYMGIERTTFVIGSDGKIQMIYRKVKVPGHVESVLNELV